MGVMILCGLFGATFSYETPGVRLELLLNDWSKQTGESLHCPQFLNNEVIATSFENQSIDTIKAQLARVVHGTWTQKEDGWWLGQTGEQQKEEKNWNIAHRRALVQWELDHLKKNAPTRDWTQGEAEQFWIQSKKARSKSGERTSDAKRQELRLETPQNRFVARVAALLKPEFFPLESFEYDRSRYAVNGLPGHVRLPIDLSSAFQSYKVENDLLKIVSGQEKENPARHFEVRAGSFEAPEFNIYIYDDNWQYVDSCWASFDAGYDELVAEGENFALSPETQAVMNYSNLIEKNLYDDDAYPMLKQQPLYPRITQAMREATKTDPLGLLQGPCWIDFAKGQHKPLMVNLEDQTEMYRPKQFVPTEKQKSPVLGMQRIDEGGWVLGRPINPLLNRTLRIDRSLVERFTKLVADTDVHSIETQIPLQDIGRYCWTYALGVPNYKFLVGYDAPSNGVFCLLGTLSQDQLKYCANGGRIPANQLPDRAKRYLTDLWANGNLDELSPLAKGEANSTPIYMLPNGIQGMNLTVEDQKQQVFEFVRDDAGQSPRGSMVLADFASLIREAIQGYPVFLEKPFKVGTARGMTAKVYLGDKFVTQTVTGPQTFDEKTYTWKTLPDSMKAPILDAMKRGG